MLVAMDPGAVNDQRDVRRRHASDFAELPEPGKHALGLVLGRALDLVEEYTVIGLQHQVGVGAADVDPYPRHGLMTRA